ncbi:hypothetical protein [Cupriavidus sp. D384]|uniref:hypothetical protein n=1 Tax=Cupriavidus sp. D384 TaxID=1538095 RepID=UPI00082B9DF8|nr:hypothetical protein [Cupriavidus sp. D384]
MTPTIRTAHSAALGLALACCLATPGHAEDIPAPAPNAPPPGYVQPVNWNDTYLGYRWAPNSYFPGSDHKVVQNIGFLNTVGGFKYGSYFFNVEYLVSDKNNPEANGTGGAQEIYSVGRVAWSASKILGRPLDYGVIHDAGLVTGFDFSAKNDAFGNRARMFILGPSIDFAVPRGFWNVMLGLRTESNHNGISHTDVTYSTAFHAESTWNVPFHVASAPLVFKGFVSLTGPKGKDGFHTETKTELLMRTSLLLDVGALAGHPRVVYMGPGYEYWHNMFGTPSSEAPGTLRSQVMLVTEVHF